MERTYWQIAAGSQGRTLVEHFLKYGIAFVGGHKHEQVMKNVQLDDVVILKDGKTISAAGIVVERNGIHNGYGDKEWLNDFDGWRMPAYCYVDWYKPLNPVKDSSLTRTTINRTHQQNLTKLASEILQTGTPVEKESEPLPVKPIADDTLIHFLILQGLRPGNAQEVSDTLARIRRLTDFYWDSEKRRDSTSEDETRAFLIIPFLIALGWSEQQMRLEHSVPGVGRVDVACFSKPYSRSAEDKCVMLIEAKSLSQGLDYAGKQAQRYAEHFPECRVVVVSNGFCYKTYHRGPDNLFSTQPHAYMNLQHLADRYPLDPENVKGAQEVLEWLIPNNLLT